MAKIFSIITALLAAAAIYFGMESGKRVKALQEAGEKQVNALKSTNTNLVNTKEKLATTEATLTKTKDELTKTSADLAAAKEARSKAETELAAAKTELDSAKGNLEKITTSIKQFFPDADIAKGFEEISGKITDLTNKTKEYEAKVADQEKQLAELKTTVDTLNANIKSGEDKIANQGRTIERYTKNIMEKGVRGRVMAVNPGWGFAVLSVGDRAGAAASKTMIVVRDGRAIGKVRITNVEATQSVADIIPGTFARGNYVQPGDQVIYTGDDKVKIEEQPATAAPAPAASPAGQPALPQ